jgi:GH25 family lysozyme M1 (1,4-beta-N-acetylmuramidase)
MRVLHRKTSSRQKKKRSHPFQTLALRPTVMVIGALAIVFGPVSTLGQRALGVDVSHHNGSGINWSSVHNAGITFAWTKATEGTYFIDGDFTSNESGAKAAGVKMGAYHFAQPSLTSPGSEENYFWSMAGSYINADGKTLMPMLDMEVFTGVVGASSYSAWANAWCKAAVSDASGAGVSINPFIYVSACNACYFDSSVSQWFADIANYSGNSAQSSNPWTSCSSCNAWGAGQWDVWQYSSSGSVSGISGGVDVDVFNGSSSGLTSQYVAKTTASTGWHTWSSLGGILTSAPSACSYGANLIDVYVRGTDNQIWQRSWNGTAWTSVWIEHTLLPSGITAAGAPAASANNQVNNREDLYVVGSDGNLWHDWWAPGSGWRGWQNLGNPGVNLVGAPAATTWAAGRYDVVAVGTDGATYHIYYNSAGWAPWQNLGGLTQYDPTACSWGPNRLDIYVNGSGLIYHKYWAGSGWIDWYQDLPEIRTSYALGSSSWGTGRIDLFANYGGSIRHCWYNGSRWAADWSEAHPGVTATSAACSTSWGYNRIDVFVRGSDNTCQHMYWGE